VRKPHHHDKVADLGGVSVLFILHLIVVRVLRISDVCFVVANRLDSTRAVHTDDEETMERLQASCLHGRYKENCSRQRPPTVSSDPCGINVVLMLLSTLCFHGVGLPSRRHVKYLAPTVINHTVQLNINGIVTVIAYK